MSLDKKIIDDRAAIESKMDAITVLAASQTRMTAIDDIESYAITNTVLTAELKELLGKARTL